MPNTTRSNSWFANSLFCFPKFYSFVIAINCVRLLTRLLPYIFEEPEWRGFFWSDIPTGQQQQTTSNGVRRNI
jgi:hypothetical protein